MKLTESQLAVIREHHRRAREAQKALRDILLAALPSPEHELDLKTGIVSLPEDEG